METLKNRTIEACRELADKYRNPKGKQFFFVGTCPLCRLYSKHTDQKDGHNSCKGCFMADEYAGAGCCEFQSYIEAIDSITGIYRKENISEPTIEFLNRANFFEMVIPILEKIPSNRFTPSGWKYFDMISRNW